MSMPTNDEIIAGNTEDTMGESIYIDDVDDDDGISLSTLSKKVDKLQEDIDKIIIILQNDVKNNCDKMSEHIDFIDNVYTRVKYPMDYVVDKINNTRNMLT
jgi:hypothetical protein